MRPFLSVIIPSYNESKRLPPTLIDVDKKLSARHYSYEIIVVNDGSTDSTAKIVNHLSKTIKNLRLIENVKNHGKGWAVRQGMLSARGAWRLFMDADNSTSIDHFDSMVPFFKEGFDVVIGSRAITGACVELPQPFYRRVLGKMAVFYIQILVLRGFKDIHCGFKCFSEKSARRIFTQTRINRWGLDVEMLVLAKLFGFRIKEIPVRWLDDVRSKASIFEYIATLWDIVKIRFWLILKKYNPTQ